MEILHLFWLHEISYPLPKVRQHLLAPRFVSEGNEIQYMGWGAVRREVSKKSIELRVKKLGLCGQSRG